MDINIDQLDGEEKKKINALLKERNDVDRNKGVDYIFKQSDDREEFLLGKKLDINRMVKDDKAMMGESELEFQERMEKRKLMQKMREDPMAIIQLNEQQAHKVAMEKQRVYQKLSKTCQSKFQRNRSVSSSDSDSSDDCVSKLQELLKKNLDNDAEESIVDILSQINPVSTHRSNPKKRQSSKSPSRNRNDNRKPSRNEYRSRSPSMHRRRKSPENRRYNEKNNSNHRRDNEKRHERRSMSKERSDKMSRRRNNDDSNRKYDRRRSRSNSTKRVRSPQSRTELRKRSPEKMFDKRSAVRKPKMSEEERQRRLQQMKDNATELDSMYGDLDRRFKQQDDEQEARMEKNVKTTEEYMYRETLKISQKFTLADNIRNKNRQKQINKLFHG